MKKVARTRYGKEKMKEIDHGESVCPDVEKFPSDLETVVDSNQGE